MKVRRALIMACFFLSAGILAGDKKVVILGIDGLDPRLLRQYMDQGLLPHFSAMVADGEFKELQTTMAPQSPVAWSTFITGMDPGGHAIYDFVHRDPKTMAPFSSMARTSGAARSLNLGSYVIPLGSGQAESLRKGRAFWELLGENGVTTTIFRMPVNFPPVEVEGNYSLSGMGTPDILGSLGTFSFFTTQLPQDYQSFTGGKAYLVRKTDHSIEAELTGPENPFRRFPKKRMVYGRASGDEVEYEHPKLKVPFQVFVDEEARAAKFQVQDHEFILKEHEWSDWLEVQFDGISWLPGVTSVSSTGRFYLKSVVPEFELYVSPLQINPADPSMPISHPAGWSRQICQCVGFFYTQQLPEDTKAFSCGVFEGKDFWDQSMFVYEERMRTLRHVLKTHESDLLFFYFMTVDQGCHMLWRYMDSQHPHFIQDDFLIHGIQKIYQKMDDVVGFVRGEIDPDTTLIVMSDHGFGPFYWGVNLNTWLWKEGYIQRNVPLYGARKGGYFSHVDWSRTRAYAVGLNGLYVNLKGREKFGSVDPADYQAVLDELEADLLAMTDPRTGKHPVTKVTQVRRDFHGPHREDGPDIIVGYSWGYRSSWENPLGEFPDELFVENHNAWSGDHCCDNRLVPGVLVTNQRISMDAPALYDLTVGVLDEFGVAPLPEMIGQDCLAEPVPRVGAGNLPKGADSALVKGE